MIYDLRSLFVDEGSLIKIDLDIDFSDVKVGSVHPIKDPVKVNGVIKNSAGVVSIDAAACVCYSAPCDRCGVDCSERIEVPVSFTLVTSMANEERDDYIVLDDMKLEIEPLVLSEILLNLPQKHLCKPDCKGLCFKCGKNLNDGQCACSEDDIDPRLAALKGLLDRE